MAMTVNDKGGPRVCVLILNYNGKNHLEYNLPSLCATDYANVELVLLDNASTDESLKFTVGWLTIAFLRS